MPNKLFNIIKYFGFRQLGFKIFIFTFLQDILQRLLHLNATLHWVVVYFTAELEDKVYLVNL